MSKQKYWITYFISLLFISIIMGCILGNHRFLYDGILLGSIYFGIYFILLTINAVYHYYKINNIKIWKALFETWVWFAIAGLLIHLIDDYSPYQIVRSYRFENVVIPNDFVHWFLSGFFVGSINSIGILLESFLKKK